MSDVGNPMIPSLGARPRHPHRCAALSCLARRRGGRGADRYHGALARRSRGVRARLLVFVRGSVDGGRSSAPPYRAQGARADVSHQYRNAARPGRLPARWWCRCGRSSRRDAIRAVQITSRFPAVHGAPVHLGHPHAIGIADIGKPDYGDPVPVEADEIPVFWACGVTPQAVIAAAKLPFAITHAPGIDAGDGPARTSSWPCFRIDVDQRCTLLFVPVFRQFQPERL